jgi:hypothetical protein
MKIQHAFNKTVLLIVLIGICQIAYGQKKDSTIIKKPFYKKISKHFNDTTKRGNRFEISFGQNLLYISNNKQINLRKQSAVVVPTSAILFFAEFRPKKTMRIPLFVNIATESKQYIIDGQLVNERASPTFGTGIVFRLLELNLDRKSKIELEVGPLASVLADQNKKIRFSPVLATRFKLCRGENFVMYFGLNYSVGINAFGILYGTGTNF